MRRLVALHIVSGVLGGMPLLAAQGAVTLEAAGQARQIAVPAQPIETALNEFAKQSGVHVVIDSRVAGRIVSNAVSGEMRAEDALAQMLRSTGLTYRVLDAQTISVEKAQGVGAPKEARAEDSMHFAQVGGGASPSDDARSPVSSSGAGEPKLEEVVVTAQKRKENLKDVPISISVLDGRVLDKFTGEGVADALSRVPGVAISANAQGGGNQLTVRGVTSSGAIFAGGSPIAYYLDSTPVGMVKSAIVPDTNAYDLDRIEVLRGPQGTLYGASALNGVVRVLTKDADLDNFDFKARAMGSATETGGGNYSGDLAVNVPIVEGKLAARAVVSDENLDGWIDNLVGSDRNTAELRNARLKLNAQPTENLSVGLSIWRTTADYGAPSTAADDGVFHGLSPQPVSTKFTNYGLKVGYEFPVVSVSSSTGYLDYKNPSYIDITPIDPTLGSSFQYLQSKVFSEELLLRSKLNGRWRWSAGAFYRDGRDRTVQPGIADYADTSSSVAVFGEVGYRFLDALELTLGIRQFHDDAGAHAFSIATDLTEHRSSFNATTPRAVLTWTVSRDLMVYGSYSQGFRSGVIQSPLTEDQQPGFPAAEPDRLNNFEVGAKGAMLDGLLVFDSALYYMDWQKVQQTIGVPIQGHPGLFAVATINGASASGVGADLALTVRPLSGLSFGLTASWNNLETDADILSFGSVVFQKGQRLNYSPEYTTGAFGDYTVALGHGGFNGHFQASANYTSEKDSRTSGTEANPGDAMFIASASFAVEAPRNWTATLFVDNLTNQQGSPFRWISGLPDYNARIRPRTYGVQFEYRLK